MVELRRRLARALRPWLLVATTGCAAVPAPRMAPPPRPLDQRESAALAVLLRLADRRELLPEVWESAVTDSSERVRRQAALGLGQLRSPRATPYLLRLLTDQDTSVAATAAFGLGLTGDTAAAPALLTRLEPQAVIGAPTVAAEAAAALGFLRSDAAHEALRQVLRTAPLSDPRYAPTIRSALLAIWRFPRPTEVGEVLRWLDHPDPEIRWRSVYALVRRPTPAATERLLSRISDPEEEVRALAVRGVTAPMAAESGAVDSISALATLLPALRDTSYAVRVNAVRSIGTFSQPAAVQALREVLGGADPHLVQAALEALGRMGEVARPAASAVEALAVAGGTPVALRQVALEALVRIETGSGRRLAVEWASAPEWRLRASSARALGSLPPPLPAEWWSLLRDRDPRVAAAAVQGALAGITGPPTLLRSALVEVLGSPDQGVRAAAIDGLARLADPSLQPLLLDAYDRARSDPENDAALAAIRALAELDGSGVSSSRAFFARFPRSDDYLVRQLVTTSFGERARSAWGDPLPLEPSTGASVYSQAVREWLDPAANGRPRVRIETEEGAIDLELYATEAPLTVHSFLSLARSGYFDGQEWPRVVPNFVVQGGDPRGDTSGGPGYTIRDEINRHRYLTGTLGMALSGPDTGGSQFFITHSPQPHLDGVYTVFGGVLSGHDVAHRILPGQRILRVVEIR